MIASRRGFLTGLTSLVAAPAVIAADRLMPVRSIVKPYATVWGVGWDLEVVEHVVWTPECALMFPQNWDSGLGKFREVTEIVYTKPQVPLAPMYRPKDWQQRKTAAQEWFVNERKVIVNEATGFTNVAGYGALEEWKLEKSNKMFNDTRHLTIKA